MNERITTNTASDIALQTAAFLSGRSRALVDKAEQLSADIQELTKQYEPSEVEGHGSPESDE